MFRTVPSDAFQGEMLAKLLIDKGIEEVAVTYVNNDYGRGLSDAFSSAFEDGGGSVLENLAHEDNRADYRSEHINDPSHTDHSDHTGHNNHELLDVALFQPV